MIDSLLAHWHEAATTTVGLFWTAFWAFGLGYVISALVQVFVGRRRLRRSLGETSAASVSLGTFFGFVSSSCSFAALSTTRSLFARGAALIPSLAFLLASTNLVIELGIVIGVFLGWQFVVGEYLGGILLILLMWLVVRLTLSRSLERDAREHAASAQDEDDEGDEDAPLGQRLRSGDHWVRAAERYVMEWHMVWRDVTVGFVVAGMIAAWVPDTFFRELFIGSADADPGFLSILFQCIAGPVAAFFTFIGSMGNIPLAAVLFGSGVSFAGVMAFIFSDLVVIPVLRIQARYYGWPMALYLLAVFFLILVLSALLLHYGFAALGMLPDPMPTGEGLLERDYFAVNHTLVFNLLFLTVSGVCVAFYVYQNGLPGHGNTVGERLLTSLAALGLVWSLGGAVLPVTGLL